MAKKKAPRREVTLSGVLLYESGYREALLWVQSRILEHALTASDDMSVLVFCEEVGKKLESKA
jgi:hypothetical protein